MPTDSPELSPNVSASLAQHGIDPILAGAKLLPFADLLTPSMVNEAMTATSWSPNAKGGARLTHLLRWLERYRDKRGDIEARHAERIRKAKAAASRMARGVRERVQRLRLADWIALWAYTLDRAESRHRGMRALEYLTSYGSSDIRRVVAEKHVDPLDADWLRAVAWDDLRPASQRSIIGGLEEPM